MQSYYKFMKYPKLLQIMPLFYELFITFAPKLYHCVVFNDYEIEI